MSEMTPSNSTASSSDTGMSGGNSPRKSGSGSTALVGGAVVVVLLVLAAGVWWRFFRTTEATEDIGAVATVTRGPLVLSVTESGEVEAANRRVIANELPWAVVIAKVVPEGTRVTVGQEVVVYESKDLEDRLANAELDVAATENEYIQASETLALRKKEMEHLVRTAEQGVRDAQEDLKRYIDGDWPIDQAQATSKIAIAEQDLALARGQLEFKLKVNSDKSLNSPYSDNEIKADRLKVQRLELALQQAQWEQKILLEFTDPRQRRRLQAGVDDAKLSLEKANVEQRTTLLSAEAASIAKKRRFEMAKSKFEELQGYQQKLVVKAEDDGLVVYDTGGGWRGNNVTVEVGASIGPRQQIMIIPDMSSLQVRTRVYESSIKQVHVGLPAIVKLKTRSTGDALSGRVSYVAPVASSQGRWLTTGAKVFDVLIELTAIPAGLKPGATADVTIVLAELPDVVSIPIAAAYTQKGKHYVRVAKGNRIETVAVKLGRMNDQRVVVLDGLTAGQRVLLVPPSGLVDRAKSPSAVEEPAAPKNGSASASTPPKGAPAGAPAKPPARKGTTTGRRTRPSREGG